MGLDVYVRWGEVDEDGDYDWYDETSPYHDCYEEQMTGYQTAPYAGYLRESWGSLSWVSEVANKHRAPDPYNFFEGWDGYNGGVLKLYENDNLQKVLDFRDKVLRPWIRDGKDNTFQSMVSDLEGEERNKAVKEFNAFKLRIADAIGFINFIELHKDKPNLAVIFG